MDNYVEELNNRIENLYERINKVKNILIAYNLIEKGNSNKAEGAPRFGVDERSIQRDIDDIRAF